MYRQYIIVNRGLKMSRGKLMAQASHASMAFLTTAMRRYGREFWMNDNYVNFEEWLLDKKIFEEWIDGEFGKIVLAVDSEKELNDIISLAEAQDFREGYDFFPIRDNCRTELIPDESGTRLTCIGFIPMDKDNEKLQSIVGNLPLFR